MNNILLYLFLFNFFPPQKAIPVYFKDYGIEINEIPKLNDTIYYNKSDIEDFKIVFFDNKGKSYLERYIRKKIFEKGYFENSLDTLKQYSGGRDENGKSSEITIESYFEPLKNGYWITYKKKYTIKNNYLLGVLIPEFPNKKKFIRKR